MQYSRKSHSVASLETVFCRESWPARCSLVCPWLPAAQGCCRLSVRPIEALMCRHQLREMSRLANEHTTRHGSKHLEHHPSGSMYRNEPPLHDGRGNGADRNARTSRRFAMYDALTVAAGLCIVGIIVILAMGLWSCMRQAPEDQGK